MSNVCPMCETAFPDFASARILGAQAIRSGRCLLNQSAQACEWEEKAETEAFSLALIRSVPHFSRASIVDVEISVEIVLFAMLEILTKSGHPEGRHGDLGDAADWRRTVQ